MRLSYIVAFAVYLAVGLAGTTLLSSYPKAQAEITCPSETAKWCQGIGGLAE